METQHLVGTVERLLDELKQDASTHKEIFDRLRHLEENHVRIEVTQESIAGDLGEIKATLKLLVEKPSKNWDKLVWAIGSAVVTSVIYFALKTIGIV